jgi:hypothetical protein
MHWRFGLKIREQFTVSAFSLTVWQTSLHILINVYWNKYGLIQTDATNDIFVYSFLAWLITESITMHSVHLPFQYSKVYRLRIKYHMTNKNQDNYSNFRFQIGNGRQSKRLLANLGRILLFHFFFFFIKIGIQDFLLDIYSAYKSFVWTAAIGLEVSGSNNIVSILPLY